MIRLTKEFGFEASHALWHYNGKCANLHGHSYKFNVTIAGDIVNDPQRNDYGMLMDFGMLKKIINENIIDVFDHSVVLNSKADYAKTIAGIKEFDNVHIVDYQPTCENMLIDFAKRIQGKLPKNIYLESMMLRETPNSFAEWSNSRIVE